MEPHSRPEDCSGLCIDIGNDQLGSGRSWARMPSRIMTAGDLPGPRVLEGMQSCEGW